MQMKFWLVLQPCFVASLAYAAGCNSMATRGNQPTAEQRSTHQSARSREVPVRPLLERLKAMAASAGPQSESQGLRLEWSDMQGLHGGTTLRVQGDGSTVLISKTGDRSTNKPGVIAAKDVQALLADLLRIGVFSTKSSQRSGVPEEVRLRVTATLRGETIEVWRWQSDLTPGVADPIGQAKALFQRALSTQSP